MTAAELRAKIVEREKPNCSGEPDANAISNWISTFWDPIFGNDREQLIKCAKILGYNPDKLRPDTLELIEQLKKEMDPESAGLYFSQTRGWRFGQHK